jgi:hypothetical protein
MNLIKELAAMNKFFLKAATLIAGLILSATASAKLFQNSYVSFQLPENWDCNLDATEWVCTPKIERGKKKNAVIILTAKEKGPTDSLVAYTGHLKTPRLLPVKGGAPAQSKILQVTQRKISDWEWIDGMHMGSEVSTYYTRYLGTVKDQLAILVTFSAHKLHYTKYSQEFLTAIQSLKVIASKDILSKRPGDVRSSQETIGAPIGGAFPTDLNFDELPAEPSGSGFKLDANSLLALLIALIGIVGFFILKRKKKPKKPLQRK